MVLETKTGGAHITPSGRSSIHNHPGCMFQSSNMNRYGLLENDESDSGSEQSFDVPDGNALSKPVVLNEALFTQNTNILSLDKRRNSYHLLKKQFTEDDDVMISRSAPAYLPSPLYSSNISEDELRIEHQTSGQLSDASFHSIETPNRSHNSRNGSHVSAPSLVSGWPYIQEDTAPSLRSSFTIPVLSIVCILVAVCVRLLSVTHGSQSGVAEKERTPSASVYNELNFYTDIDGLGQKYNVDEESILLVQNGISTIHKNNDTASFMFVYNSNAINFNPSKFDNFMDDVSITASKYLRNDSKPVHYIKVESTELDMKDHEQLISRYRQELQKTGVMLVRRVDKVPSGLAMAFHYYCDEYNPLVKKSAIFFTLNLANCPQDYDYLSHHALIEKCLAEKWSSVALKSIGPLLTRVVSVVIDVTSAF